MATRSLNQNNFYYAFITDIHKQCLEKHITVENMEYLRNGLKEIDALYPKVCTKGKIIPISSAKLDTKQMVNHIEFVIEFVGRFGITPKFVEDEWKIIQQQIRN